MDIGAYDNYKYGVRRTTAYAPKIDDIARGAECAKSLVGRDGADHDKLRTILIALAQGVEARVGDATRYGIADDQMWAFAGMPDDGYPTVRQAEAILAGVHATDASTPQTWCRCGDLLEAARHGDLESAEDGGLFAILAEFFLRSTAGIR